MRRARSTTCALLLGAIVTILSLAEPERACASGGSDLKALIDPEGAAQAKLGEAQRLLLTQHPLDMGRIAGLIDDVHKTLPVLDPKAARIVRHLVIAFFGHETSNHTVDELEWAVTFDHSLAFDDTLTKICDIICGHPPTMEKLVNARKAAEAKSHPPAPIRVVPYVPPSEQDRSPFNPEPEGGTAAALKSQNQRDLPTSPAL